MCTVRLLMIWCGHQTMQVKWGTNLSSLFTITNEIRHGGVLGSFSFFIHCLRLQTLKTAVFNRSGVHCGKYGGESSNVCWWDIEICVLVHSICGLQYPLIFVEIMLQSTKSLLIATNKSCTFCPKKYKQLTTAPSNVFLHGANVQLSDQVKYRGVSLNALLKDEEDIQRHVQSLYCAANKLKSTLTQCWSAIKNTFFCAYSTPIYSCQFCRKYMQTYRYRV